MPERKKGRPWRCGYTTGACAAAAAQAAVTALTSQRPVDRVEITLPRGEKARFRIEDCVYDSNSASCSVRKDAGDDPDVTDGAEVRACVSWKAGGGIEIKGGKGVGVVTKPGLEVPVGKEAINPVPYWMIRDAVKRVAGNCLNGRGVRVTISVPAGEKLARKTLNPRLGIVGGISILGTTGLVIPYSVSAYKACISQALDVAVACGCRQIVLTTGRRSEKYAQGEMALPEECFLQAGDFIGYALGESVRKGMSKATVWGMVGKISKLAAGHLYTNVSDSTVDIDFLVGVAADCGMPGEVGQALRAAVTAHQLLRLLPVACVTEFCHRLCCLAVENCRAKTDNAIAVECIMTDYNGTILGRGSARE